MSAETAAGVRQAALHAYAAGLSVLPPVEDGSKRPLADLRDQDGRPTWKPYQQMRATPEHVAQWYRNGRRGVGAVLGAISSNVQLFEFDDADTYREFLAAADAIGIGAIVAWIRDGYEEATPSGGVHWLFRCTHLGGNDKLARRPKRPEEQTGPHDTVKTLIETKENGGFVILAPSYGPVHPTKRPYRLLSGGFDTIATIEPAERAELYRLARTFDQLPEEPQQRPPEPKANAAAASTRPGDDFNERASWATILEPAGWQHVYDKLWRRPGKEDGWSASVDYQGSGLLYVFSSSTPFAAKRGYSKFAAYAVLNHGGDHTAAARALGSSGYGKPAERPPTTPREPRLTDLEEPLKPPPKPKRLIDLQREGLPAIRYAVEQILPEGVTLCAGRPKQGKSMLALNLAIAVAAGGKALGDLPVLQGDVLYLTLEGGEHGLLPRVQTMLSGGPAPEALDYATEWPRMDEGGAAAIAAWLDDHPRAQLVIVDTLQRVRPPTNGRQGVYEQDYGALQPLIALAQRYRIAILVIHHTRKSAAEDVLDTVSGSTGLTGAVDAVWVLQRVRGQDTAVLTVSGRSLPDLDLGLQWDDTLLCWRHAGTGQDARRSAERRAILEAMENDGGGPLTIQEVCHLTGQEYNAVRKLLWLMERSGELRKETRGYVVPLS